MSEMEQHTILTLLNAWHWARDHKADYCGKFSDYAGYVVCYEAQVAIERELCRRDHRAFMAWARGPILDSCKPDKYFMPEEAANA
jgi:hypothetical protein